MAYDNNTLSLSHSVNMQICLSVAAPEMEPWLMLVLPAFLRDPLMTQQPNKPVPANTWISRRLIPTWCPDSTGQETESSANNYHLSCAKTKSYPILVKSHCLSMMCCEPQSGNNDKHRGIVLRQGEAACWKGEYTTHDIFYDFTYHYVDEWCSS